MSPASATQRYRFFARKRIAVFAALASALLAGCEPGKGFIVGPFPTTIPLAEQTISQDDVVTIPVNGGISGVFVPLCDLPTRADAEAILDASADPELADHLDLHGIPLVVVNVFAKEGSFTGIQSATVYYIPSAGLIGLLSIDEVASTEQGAQPSDLIELLPVDDGVDLLAMIDDAESLPQGECPTLFLRIEGEAPEYPIVIEGEVLADVYGVFRF